MRKRSVATLAQPNLPLVEAASETPALSDDALPTATTAGKGENLAAPREIKISNTIKLTVTPVFDTYWNFAAKRQTLFMRRVMGGAPPWTDDPILMSYRFTNVYRAA